MGDIRDELPSDFFQTLQPGNVLEYDNGSEYRCVRSCQRSRLSSHGQFAIAMQRQLGFLRAAFGQDALDELPQVGMPRDFQQRSPLRLARVDRQHLRGSSSPWRWES